MDLLEVQWFIGRVLGYILVFVWIPLAFFASTDWAIKSVKAILPTLPTMPKKKKREFPDPTPQEDPIPDRVKKPKKAEKYAVETSYSDDHKIIPPVQWGD